MEVKLAPRRVLVLLFVFASALHLMAQTPAAFDVVITNGHIIDGTGSPWYSADLGIREGMIATIGNLTAQSTLARAKSDAAIYKLLTPDQRTKYSQMQAEMGMGRGGPRGRGGRGGDEGGAPGGPGDPGPGY